MNQYCWNFFPEDSREKIKNKLGEFALKYRKAHPDKTLKVPFWPQKFLEAFKGLNEYDAYFGETFYNDSFNSGIDYNELLSNIKCSTLFMKAKTIIGEDGLVQGALTDEDLQQVTTLIKNIKVEYFNCGHGIHSEKPKEFIRSVKETLTKQKLEQDSER
jgi:pimeloyl-ACP methyl ester carboxylesterase